jgi:predicted  nucleic acid-binding Zn-ribbon protein
VAENKKGLWSSLKSLAIEDVPDPSAKSAVPLIPTTRPNPGAVPPPWVAPPRIEVSVDPATLSKIEGKLQASTPPVYAAFMDQFQALEAVIPDEATRFKAALVASRSSIEQISGSIDQLLVVLASLLDEFNRKFEDNQSKAETTAKQQMEADTKLIATCEEQLKAIQAQIATLRTKVDSEQAQVQAESARREGVRQSFKAAYDQVFNRLTAQKQRISQRV